MPSVMTRCAASAIDCRPELQKRLTDNPAVLGGRPARSAIGARDVAAGRALAERGAHDHVLDLAGLDAGALDGVLAPRGRRGWRRRSC